MDSFVLSLHNIVRWIALVLGIVVTALSIYGWIGKRVWSRTNRMFGIFYSSALDIQILLGLLMYFVYSDLTRAALQNLAETMGNPGLRFFALEHVFYMILGVVFAHLGNIFSKKADDDNGKFKRAAFWFGLSLIMLLIGMPWDRPFFRGF